MFGGGRGYPLRCDLSHDARDVTCPQPHGQIDACENITFLQLFLLAVIIERMEIFINIS